MPAKRAFTALTVLRAFREFEKQYLPFLGTTEDLDLLCAIGCRQAERRPLTVKELLLLNLSSVPTVQRRLRHLRQAGAVTQARCAHDRRAIELGLTQEILEALAKYADILRQTLPPEPAAGSAPSAAERRGPRRRRRDDRGPGDRGV